MTRIANAYTIENTSTEVLSDMFALHLKIETINMFFSLKLLWH